MTQNANIYISFSLRFCKKLIRIFCIFVFYAFWVISFVPIKIQICQAPQHDCLNLSFVKDEHIVGKNMARNCHKTAIYHGNICILCHNF